MSRYFADSATLSLRFIRFPHLTARALALATALPLILLLALLQGAAAQEYYPQNAPLDPPGSVARLNLVEGAVSLAPAEVEENTWTRAVLNRPLTSGDRLWTGPRARAELHAGSTAVRMSEQTSLDFLALDDRQTQLRLAQGSVQLRVRTLFEGQRLEVDTPNLALVISEPGDYRLDVNPASNTTRVVALSGSGVLYGDSGAALTLGSQQQGSFSGTQLTPAAPGPAVQDSFDAWAAARDRLEDQSVSARYVPRETIGYLQLDTYGDWQQDPSYGAVWLPRALPVDWAPYRVGHWSWISPWGWTWVDDAPWGFAPFHYGRWAQLGPRWAWVPGHLPQRPVYAPALVAFVGGGSGGISWNISIGSGGIARPGVGWFPLAPGEAFRPAYRASPRYITQINNNIVVNNTLNSNNINISISSSNNYRYQNQPAAVTAVSREEFVRGRPLQGNMHALSATDLGRSQVLVDRGALPQRPGVGERPRPAPAAALPPAAVVLQAVIRSPGERGNDRRGTPGLNDARQTGLEINARNTGAQAMPAAPPPAAPSALAPALRTFATPTSDRNAVEAAQRAQQQQQQQQQLQLQRGQVRQQDAPNRPNAAAQERGWHDPTPRNGNSPTLAAPDARSAADQAQRAQQQQQFQRDLQDQPAGQIHLQEQKALREQAQQAQQAQQLLQRDPQRLQAEQARQQEQQRRQSAEAQGQRALRDQAQRQQEQSQQQLLQRDQQRLQAEQARQQEQQRIQATEAQGQRALREQAQRQQEQSQKQEQHRTQAQERQKPATADAADGRTPRPEGERKRNREP